MDLLDAADLLPGELVSVVDVNNGNRGHRGTGVVGVNGAAARLAHVGDLVIIISYAQMSTKKAKSFEPSVVHVDQRNRIIQVDSDPSAAHVDGLMSPPSAAGR